MALADKTDSGVVMFGANTKLTQTRANVDKAVDKGAYKTLKHAAFSIRKSAIASMVFAKGPSRAGSPPHAHTGRLGRSILVAQDKQTSEVVVGPSYDRVTKGGRPPWMAQRLEHGGTFTRKKKRKRRGRPRKGESQEPVQTVTFPSRPFMYAALQRSLARFHAEWKGAIS